MIDLTNPAEFKNLKLDDLIADAVERKDRKALEWLKDQATTTKKRTRDDGTTYEVKRSIVEIRANYLKEILKYKSKSELAKEKERQAKRDKAKKELEDKFEAAFAKL